MLAEQVAQLLKDERVRQGLSREQAAARMDRHATFVYRIEHNIGDRQASAFDQYADALGVKIEVSLTHEQHDTEVSAGR